MKIFITGGAGTCGTILQKLPYEKIFFDKRPHPDTLKNESYIQGELNNISLITKHIKGCDTLIHLAASDYYPDFKTFPQYSLFQYHQNNIDNLSVLFDIAIKQGVNKIIFASTHRVMGLYESDQAPEIYSKNNKILLDHLTPTRPDSFYALTKVFGENLGRLLVDQGKCSFQVIRICSVRSEEENHPYAYAENGVSQKLWERDSSKYKLQVNRLKGLWQSRDDFLNMSQLLLSKELTGYDIFYGLSNNTRKWFDLSHAEEILGYFSTDNAEKFTKCP